MTKGKAFRMAGCVTGAIIALVLIISAVVLGVEAVVSIGRELMAMGKETGRAVEKWEWYWIVTLGFLWMLANTIESAIDRVRLEGALNGMKLDRIIERLRMIEYGTLAQLPKEPD